MKYVKQKRYNKQKSKEVMTQENTIYKILRVKIKGIINKKIYKTQNNIYRRDPSL